MIYDMNCRIYGMFYHGVCKKELKKKGYDKKAIRNIKSEYKKIVLRTKDIGKNRMMSAYMMGAYFIALNRGTGLSAQENYEIFKDGLYASKLFHKVMGNAETYLDEKKLPGRKQWSEESYRRKYENDWVVDILEGNEEYDLGYDYHECGVCKLCRDEGCPELAKYLCQLDFVLADMMDMKLVRTKTIAEGGDFCDFRYSRRRNKQ